MSVCGGSAPRPRLPPAILSRSEVAAVLPAHLVEGVGDLPQTAAADRAHERREEVPPLPRRRLEPRQRRGRALGVPRLELLEARDAALLLLPGGARELDRRLVTRFRPIAGQ